MANRAGSGIPESGLWALQHAQVSDLLRTSTRSDDLRVHVIRIRLHSRPVLKDHIEIVLDDGSNRVAVWRNFIVHIRRGAQTVQSLDLLIGSWRSLKHRIDGNIFALTIIAESAGTVSTEVRKRRAAIVKELTTHRRLHLIVVIEGEGLVADLRRIMVRGVADARTKVFRDTGEAARMITTLRDAPTLEEMLPVIDAACDPGSDCPMSWRAPRSSRNTE